MYHNQRNQNSSGVGGFIWACLRMDNLAPARLFPKQAFTGVPDTMTPPTPELFFYCVFSTFLYTRASSLKSTPPGFKILFICSSNNFKTFPESFFSIAFKNP